MLLGWKFAIDCANELFQHDSVAPRDRHPQLSVIDLLALCVLLLPVLVFLSLWIQLAGSIPVLPAVMLGGVLFSIFLVVWWQGVRALNRLGIDRVPRRFVFQALLLPAMVVGSLLAVVDVMAIVLVVTDPNFPLLVWIVFTIAMAAVGVAVGFGNQWILAGAQRSGQRPPDETADDDLHCMPGSSPPT